MNIAIFCPNWIGDVAMATPAFRALRERFSGAHMIGVMKPYVADVLEGTDWFDRLLFTEGGTWSQNIFATALKLRREKIHLAVLFPNSFRSAWTAWLGKCQRIIGYAREGRAWLLTDPLRSVCNPDGTFKPSPIIDAYNRLAERAGCPNPGYRMSLETTAKDEAAADGVWKKFRFRGSTVVALNPGAAFGSAKRWPSEYFAELGSELAKNGASVLVLCGPAEREIARTIVRLADHDAVFSMAGEDVSLGLSKAILRRSDLLITTDSGPRHLAAAFDRPVITLFGPTHIEWTETYFAKAIHLQQKVDCGPCQLRVCPLDHRCMKLLKPPEVYETARSLLARYAKPGLSLARTR